MRAAAVTTLSGGQTKFSVSFVTLGLCLVAATCAFAAAQQHRTKDADKRSMPVRSHQLDLILDSMTVKATPRTRFVDAERIQRIDESLVMPKMSRSARYFEPASQSALQLNANADAGGATPIWLNGSAQRHRAPAQGWRLQAALQILLSTANGGAPNSSVVVAHDTVAEVSFSGYDAPQGVRHSLAASLPIHSLRARRCAMAPYAATALAPTFGSVARAGFNELIPVAPPLVLLVLVGFVVLSRQPAKLRASRSMISVCPIACLRTTLLVFIPAVYHLSLVLLLLAIGATGIGRRLASHAAPLLPDAVACAALAALILWRVAVSARCAGNGMPRPCAMGADGPAPRSRRLSIPTLAVLSVLASPMRVGATPLRPPPPPPPAPPSPSILTDSALIAPAPMDLARSKGAWSAADVESASEGASKQGQAEGVGWIGHVASSAVVRRLSETSPGFTLLAASSTSNWVAIALSDDAQTVFGGIDNAQIFKSVDGGASWAVAGNIPYKQWCAHPSGAHGPPRAAAATSVWRMAGVPLRLVCLCLCMHRWFACALVCPGSQGLD